LQQKPVSSIIHPTAMRPAAILAYTGSYPAADRRCPSAHGHQEFLCVSKCESQKGLAMIQIAARTKMNRDD